MAGDLTVLDGNTFFVSDPAGDVEPGPDPTGFFHADMRHLSTWRLLINVQPLYVLTSRTGRLLFRVRPRHALHRRPWRTPGVLGAASAPSAIPNPTCPPRSSSGWRRRRR